MSTTVDLPDLNVWLAALGWRARIPLAEGLQQAVMAFRGERVCGVMRAS